MSPFRRRRNRTEATFEPTEAHMLANLARQIIELLHDRHGPLQSDADPLAAEFTMGGELQQPDDPVLRRLLPDGYTDDDAESAEFRRYTEQSLTYAKVANAQVMVSAIEDAGVDELEAGEVLEIELNDQQVTSWLQTLNDMRLSLAVRLGVDSDAEAGLLEEEFTQSHQTAKDPQPDETDWEENSDEQDSEHNEMDSRGMMRDVYLWLGYVQESLISALN